jgi:hypothetical protein
MQSGVCGEVDFMPVKQTYFHRGFAIVHQVFTTDQTDEIYERFAVSFVGKPQQLYCKPSLAEAKAAIDQHCEAFGNGAQSRRPHLAATGG